MNDYWRKHFNASVEKFPDSPLKQVGKTINGNEVSREQVELWARSITQALDVRPFDVIADLCCGNGLITRIIAERCTRVVGVDFSEGLIRRAQDANGAGNITYIVADVAELGNEFYSGITKAYLYEALQHLSVEAVEKLLRHIARSKSVESFFIAGVPDIEKFDVFYDTEEKRAYQRERELSGEPHIGKWWGKAELAGIVEKSGLTATIIVQPPDLYCSHFRFDCLVARPHRSPS